MDESNTAQEQIKVSVLIPLIYVGILLTTFVTFSIIYRRKKITKLTQVQPIFPENNPALLYSYLREQYKDPNVSKENKPHEKVMKAALLKRAVEVIRRSLKLKENEPIFTRLYQEGLIGDDIYKQFEIQGKLQELELKEIMMECETYKKGWAQQFFPVAQEICFNEALRRRVNAMDDRSESLSELWEYDVEESEHENTKSFQLKVSKIKGDKSIQVNESYNAKDGIDFEHNLENVDLTKSNNAKRKTSKNKK